MIAVRVLHHGVPVRELLFRELPVTLGRGPENDVVLFDRSVSRAHARLERDEEGRLVLYDLASRNRLFREGKAESALTVEGALRLWLGRVEIEVEALSADATVELRMEERPHVEHRRGLAHYVGYVVAGVAAFLAFTVATPSYWSPLSEDRALSLMVAGLVGVIVLPAAALGLLIVLKVLGRKARVADALQALAGIAWLPPLLALLSILTYYALRPDGHDTLMGLLAVAAAVAAVIALVSLRRRGPNRRFRLAWGLGTTAVIVASTAAGRSCSDRYGTPSVSYEAYPPVMGWTGPRVDLEAHLQRVRAAASSAAAEAEEARVKRRIE